MHWEHPRACGENHGSHNQLGAAQGTSPRMRGKQKCRTGRPRILGNIPAHAGKTTQSDFTTLEAAEHPRACGENLDKQDVMDDLRGTSPRMRGKREGGASR